MTELRRIWVLFCLVLPLSAQSGPKDRELTDPKSIVSASLSQARPVPISDLAASRKTGWGAWSPDGKEVAFCTNLAGHMNLWKVSARGGWPIQLTESDDRQSGPHWSPDGQWIVFRQDSGNEIYDLWAVPSTGGEAVNLTHSDDISESGALWSHDGSTLAISYKDASGVINIALMDWKTRKVHLLTHQATKNHSWYAFAWGADDKTLFADHISNGSSDSSIYRIDVSTAAAENLTEHSGEVHYGGADLSRDGRTVLLESNQKGGFQNVATLDVATKKLHWITDTQWEAYADSFSPDGKSVTFFLNADGRTRFFVHTLAPERDQEVPMPEGLNTPAAGPSSFSPQGDRLLIYHRSSTQPNDIWSYDLGKQSVQQLTFSTIASLDPEAIPHSQIVHYKSFDGTVISAFLWMPFNLKRDSTNPLILMPHGGPKGQTVDNLDRQVAALASRGYICISPNVRGSTGYGLEFQNANHQDLGGADLKDEIAAVEFMESTGFVDSRKLGILGGSYGGFMTLMAIGKYPEMWAAAVDKYGIVDWLSLLKTSDPGLREYERSLLGDPEKDKSVYVADSPITYLHNVRTPLLVLQGEKDRRVPKEESERVVEILKHEGKTVEAHYYPTEGHDFENLDSIQRVVAWFDRYLKGTAENH
jgi:dipeptidyl aminopeptidase/acylaminoacyl peptidase